jgi:hypothetical protein
MCFDPLWLSCYFNTKIYGNWVKTKLKVGIPLTMNPLLNVIVMHSTIRKHKITKQ